VVVLERALAMVKPGRKSSVQRVYVNHSALLPMRIWDYHLTVSVALLDWIWCVSPLRRAIIRLTPLRNSSYLAA